MPTFSTAAQTISTAVRVFLAAETSDERQEALRAMESVLPPSIRVYDIDGLRVFHDHGIALPKVLSHAATYIEARHPDGRAEVVKGGFGPTQLNRSMEPAPKSALDRILEDDDLV
jgi:hypothetical protein